MKHSLILFLALLFTGCWGYYNPKNLPDDPQALLILMDNHDMQISISSAQKLVFMKRKDIYWIALDSPKAHTRMRATHMVRLFKDKAFLPKLKTMIERDNDEQVIVNAIQSYADLCDDSELEFIKSLAVDNRPLISYTAQDAIKRRPSSN